MGDSYDLIVIGSGNAGQYAAVRAAKAGWRVAVADERPFGGTCPLRGCDPKKIIAEAADWMDRTARMRGTGIEAPSARIDWPALIRRRRSFSDPIPGNTEEKLRGLGIETFRERAEFTGENALRIGGRDARAKRVFIAAGAVPAPLEFPGADLLTGGEAFMLTEALPSSIAFAGGGYISFEFAHAAARAGAGATIFHLDGRPLNRFDPDLVRELIKALGETGVETRLRERVAEIRRRNGLLEIVTERGGARNIHQAGMAVHGAGRTANLGGLNLAAGGVKHGDNGVYVNKYLQSISNPNVYAAGDAAATKGPKLTPVAIHEARVAVNNLLGGNRDEPYYGGVPSVLFTSPRLAAAGMLEEEAREAGLDIEVRHEDLSGKFFARSTNSRPMVKAIFDKRNDLLIGAHALDPAADEAVNLFALAIRNRIPAAGLRDMVWAYPTRAAALVSAVL